ncbi:hypothetical protein HOD38_04865 [archaeon]|nr:hypothetical protein [archaeon]MBT4397572.1 hypothetical protein [archaeon]
MKKHSTAALSISSALYRSINTLLGIEKKVNLQIQENNCMDEEIRVLDTRLPYFYNMIREAFVEEPKDVEIVIVGDKGQIASISGDENTVACTKGNRIFILEPSKFEECEHCRDNFYKVLYQELVHMFYLYKRN